MRTIRLLTYPGAMLLDIAAPLQVFRSASVYMAAVGHAVIPPYDISVVSMDGDQQRTTVGLNLNTKHAVAEPVDTFLIPGGADEDIAVALQDSALISFVREQSSLARRTGALSTGSFFLAAAGVLNGRRASTHWMDNDRLAREFPAIEVVYNAAYVVDDNIWTSGGLVSGMDMAAAMVEQDHGRRVADYVARIMIADARRAPGEPQVSVRAEAREIELGRIQDLMEWITENPSADLSIGALARRAHLSPRSMHRHFAARSGETPAKFVERARLQAAQRLLAKTDYPLDAIAHACGFGTAAALHRSFMRVLHTTPAQYRRAMQLRA